MSHSKIAAGAQFPECTVQDQSGQTRDISQIDDDAQWRVVVVYRGRHCPICKQYLKQLDTLVAKLAEMHVDVVALSADSPAQLQAFAEEVDVSVPLYGALSLETMRELGLYISEPRNANETDHPFPEPGVFVINERGQVQIVEISNAPFARPDLDMLVDGIKFIRENSYPIRGTLGNA
ncbi:MAG: peroxiredoxin-like family protein [Oleiphilaceae bacterium]|nr:peroxiredoxin-like family protein [Oleiphilaceae bacterium]